MKIKLSWEGQQFEADLNQPLSIALPIRDGDNNPNCYFADPVKFEVIKEEGFVGSIKEGGVVNHRRLIISPHGNGTHTECYGHITDSDSFISKTLSSYHHLTQLISLEPTMIGEDKIIGQSAIEKANLRGGITGLAIRTLPNDSTKKTQVYSGANPPYFSKEAMETIVSHGIEHLVTDLPSVDKEKDGGKLLAHKSYWNIDGAIRKSSTITELAFIPNTIDDGLYLLNIQILALEMDVSPSNPNLYSLNTI